MTQTLEVSIESSIAKLFGKEQCSGRTTGVNICLVSPTHCSEITRISNEGGKMVVEFDPPLPLHEAVQQAGKYNKADARIKHW